VSTAAAAILLPGSVLMALALTAAAPVAAAMGLGTVSDVRTLLVVSVVILLSGQYLTIATGAAFGREVQLLPNVVSSVGNVATNVGSALVALLTKDLAAYAISVAVLNVLSTLAVAGVLQVRVLRFRPHRPSIRIAHELVSFGFKSQSVPLAEILLFQFSKIVIGIGGGTAAVGAYELGSRLALGFRTLGSLPFGAVLAPQTGRFVRDGEAGVRSEIDRLAPAVIGLAILFPALGAALAPALLTLWLGRYEGLTLLVLTGLCVAFVANMLGGLQSTGADAIGRPGLNARSAGVTAVLNVVLGLAAFALLGSPGLVAATAFALIVGSFYGMWIVQKALGASLRGYLRLVAGPVAVAVLAGLLARVVVLALPYADGRLAALVAVAAGSVAFGLVFVVGMTWTRAWPLGPRSVLRLLSARRGSGEGQG
jgi:O-antigen/teichoic acid export membrane protein